MNKLRIKNIQTGEESDLEVNGLFYAIGTSLLATGRYHIGLQWP